MNVHAWTETMAVFSIKLKRNVCARPETTAAPTTKTSFSSASKILRVTIQTVHKLRLNHFLKTSITN